MTAIPDRLAMMHHATLPPVGLGISSLTLGAIGLVLFILPILGIPISVIALLIGLLGIVVAKAGGPTHLRTAVGGTGLSALALAINVGISYAPLGYVGPPTPTAGPPASGATGETAPPRPYAPPPAPLSRCESACERDCPPLAREGGAYPVIA